MPRRLPAPGEPISEYLTVRRGLFYGDGFIQTSTILAPTELLRRVPFTVGLRRQQELDWTLRAVRHDDVELIFADEPLVLWHQDENRERISLEMPWRQQLDWLRRQPGPVHPAGVRGVHDERAQLDGRAPPAARRVFRELLAEARGYGRPGAIDYLTFLQIWALPPGLRHRLRDLIAGRGRGARPDDRPPMPPERRVVIWRSALLPASETFVRNQGDALTRWRPAYLGATKVESALARADDVIAFPGRAAGFLRLRLTGGRRG